MLNFEALQWITLRNRVGNLSALNLNSTSIKGTFFFLLLEGRNFFSPKFGLYRTEEKKKGVLTWRAGWKRFLKSFGFYRTCPSGEEPVESAWKEEAKPGRRLGEASVSQICCS